MQRRRSPDASNAQARRAVAAREEAAPGAVVAAVLRAAEAAVEPEGEVVAVPPMPLPHRVDLQRLHDKRISGLLPCPYVS